MTVDDKFAFDPMDTSKSKDWDFVRSIREATAVCRPAEGLVFTSRYEETARAFRNARSFSSAGDMRAPGVVVAEEERFLGELDPPEHPRIRRILLRGFTPAAATAAEPWTRDNVARRLQAVADRGGGDLMDILAIPLPGSVAAHALGIPDSMHDQVMDWCNELLHSTWPATGRTERGEGIAGAFPELSAAIDDQIRQRKEAGPDRSDDLMGLMVHAATPDGWRIPDAHIRTLAINILAGSLSASYMIGNLLYRYLSEPEGFARTIEEDRSKIPAAVEESLRLEPPVLFMFRHATEDTDLGGCPVSAGEHLMLSIASGNRDQRVYPDPEEFRLDRGEAPEHLAFGAGPHLCLGNHLTRMVGRVVLEEMVDRFPPGSLRLAPDFEWVCVDHMLEFGPEHLQVVTGDGTRGA